MTISIEEATKLFRGKHLTITGTYKNGITPVQCTCDICGNTECWPRLANLKNGRNGGQGGCRICAMKNRAITNTAKYGGPSPMASKDVRDKQRQVLLDRTPEEIHLVTEKRKQTCLVKYGVEYASQDEGVKNKNEQTCLDRYGVTSTALVPEIRARQRQTCLNKYGVDNPLKSKEIQDKVKHTNLERYGVENPWYDKSILDKRYETNMRLYGVKHPLQYKPFADKSALAQNAATVKKHWKTGEDITCIASYEARAVDYWNTNRIDFEWQKHTFKMSDGRYYTPDAYLPGLDKWIEIKGYFWGDAEEKWSWFHSSHPNSELWNKDKLQELNLI